MGKFIVRFNTQLDMAVTVEAADEDEAEDIAWKQATEFLETVHSDNRGLIADASLDGIGSYENEEVPERD